MHSNWQIIRPSAVLLWALSLLVSVAFAAAQPRLPELNFEAPPQLAGQKTQLERFDRRTLLPMMQLLGLPDPGPPIRVIITPEGSEMARLAPSWGVAYAIGSAGTIVLMPSRIPGYPDDDLNQVLRHEVAHILISRAAGRHPVPRWFNEGLAVVASRDWDLEDRSRLLIAAFRGPGSMAEIERGFFAGPASATRAYSLSAAFVRFLLEEAGPDAAADVLGELARGQPFADALRSATGRSLQRWQELFARHLRVWHRWIPFFTSSAGLWTLISGLALLAFRRRRRLDEQQRQKWLEEEAQLEAALQDSEKSQESQESEQSEQSEQSKEWVNCPLTRPHSPQERRDQPSTVSPQRSIDWP